MRTTAGRTRVRPALLLSILLGAAAGAAFGWRTTASEPRRGPIAVPNISAEPPIDSTSLGVTFVRNGTPRESLIVDGIPPSAPSRLLFFQGRAVQPDYRGGGLAVDGGGGLIQIDDRLHVRRVSLHVDGRDIASAASGPNGSIWLVTGDGNIVLVDEHGEPVTDIQEGPFLYSVVTSDPRGRAWLVRSPDRTGFQPVFGETPLLAQLDSSGEVAHMVGNGVVPRDFLLTHLASAGRIAVSDSAIFYAPFIRDQVVALSTTGDTSWVAIRGLPQSKPEPRLEVVGGEPVVDYAPVNLAIALGPDTLLYVLSIPGFSTAESRLDVFEPSSGHLIRSTTIANALPTLAADREGRVYELDEFELMGGVPAADRQPFHSFDLELVSGGRVTTMDIQGKVTLINFWASWCAPCRIEMPALDSLQQAISDPDFIFLSMNEDVRVSNAERFLDEYGFDFPVLLGRGDLRNTYHYVGLPFTVLLDRSSNVVTRWTGFTGDDQIAAIKGIVEAELSRGQAGPMPQHGEHAGH